MGRGPVQHDRPAAEFPEGAGVRTLQRIRKALPLLGILLFAFLLRGCGWNWDDGMLLHPDERHMAMVTAALERPNSLAEWVDGRASSFTPYNQNIASFVYGQLPVNLIHFFTGGQEAPDLQEIIRSGRLLSALFSTATVALIYAFGARLISVRFGQVAALFQACVVLSIQQAHFYTVDSAGTFFATACVGLGCIFAKERRMIVLILCGAMVGLAMACRINLGLLAVWVTALAVVLSFQDRSLRPLAGLAAGGLLALILFRILHPMAFAGWTLDPRWVADLKQVHAISRGELEVPFTLQWVDRTPYLGALLHLMVYSIGLPLGIVCVSGVGWFLWTFRQRTLDWRFFALLWPLLLFLYHGRIFLHTQRYFLPAIPVLVLIGLMLLRRIRPVEVGRLATAATLLCSLIYAAAFMNMYREPHPRIQASEWLMENLPLGGSVLTEHWDDALPLRLTGREEEHRQIATPQAEVTLPERPEKIRRILEQIEEADYFVLSSTRASLSLPRMPLRYPVMTRFYHSLEENHTQSGLREVARFHRAPNLAGWRVDSLRAEEAYRVYDHPLVRVFEKTPIFEADAVYKDLTEGIDFESIPDIRYLQAGKSNAGWLSPKHRERRAAGPAWSDLFSMDAFGVRYPLLLWSMVLFVLGPLGFPLAFFLFPHLYDRGASICRLFALCILAWTAWFPAALEWIPFPQSLLIAGMGFVGVSAALVVMRGEELLRWLRLHWKRLLPGEICCWLIFTGFLLLRFQQPELWHPWAGGEKPMDLAYLNATALTPFFPPSNPWLSGAFIHYYYYGFVLVSVFIHFTGIPPEIATNLALPTFAFFTAGATGCLGTAFFPLFRRGSGWKTAPCAGLLAAFLILIPGNLAQVREALTPGAPEHPREAYWNASRAIRVPTGEVEPITEFPMFSHLYGDLHAHVMGMPLAMLSLLISWQLLRRSHPWRIAVAALVLGTVWATNTWDLPVQAAVFLFACLFPGWRDRRWSQRILQAIGGLALARLLFAPFHHSFASHPLGLQLWQGSRSSLTDLFLVHGLFLVPVVLGAILWLKHHQKKTISHHLVPLLLVTGCLSLIVFLENVHMRSDIGRMNSVFKFTYQIWWILGVLAAVLMNRFAGKRHKAFTGLVVVLILCGLYYPITALPAKLGEWKWETPAGSLNGMDYMDEAVWHLDGTPIRMADDKAAINWLRQHAEPGSVLMEGLRPLYQWGGRISWHTGLPAVLGWDGHMRQQRPWPGGAETVFQRQKDIQRFYTEADPAVLSRYGVAYVLIGDLERFTYGAEAVEKVAELSQLTPVFESGGTAVYKVDSGTTIFGG